MNMLPAFLQKEKPDMPDNPSRIEDDPEAHQFFMQIRNLRQQNALLSKDLEITKNDLHLEKQQVLFLNQQLEEAEKKRDRYQGLYARLLSAIHHIEAAIELAREEARKVEPFGAPSPTTRPRSESPLSPEDEAALRDIVKANTGVVPNVGG